MTYFLHTSVDVANLFLQFLVYFSFEQFIFLLQIYNHEYMVMQKKKHFKFLYQKLLQSRLEKSTRGFAPKRKKLYSNIITMAQIRKSEFVSLPDKNPCPWDQYHLIVKTIQRSRFNQYITLKPPDEGRATNSRQKHITESSSFLVSPPSLPHPITTFHVYIFLFLLIYFFIPSPNHHKPRGYPSVFIPFFTQSRFILVFSSLSLFFCFRRRKWRLSLTRSLSYHRFHLPTSLPLPSPSPTTTSTCLSLMLTRSSSTQHCLSSIVTTSLSQLASNISFTTPLSSFKTTSPPPQHRFFTYQISHPSNNHPPWKKNR